MFSIKSIVEIKHLCYNILALGGSTMKFGYTDELIKHYEIVDDKIVIKFLNGTKRVC